MDNENTQPLGEQIITYQISQLAEWNSLAGIEGFYFTVIAGADFGRVFLLDKPEIVLGRSDEADIQVDDEKVSRKHLQYLRQCGFLAIFTKNAVFKI